MATPPALEELAGAALCRARAEAHQGRFGEAERWLDRASRLAPADPTIALERAVALLGAGVPGEAEALLLPLAAAQDHRPAYLALAVARLAQGKREKAAEALNLALKRFLLPQAERGWPLITRLAGEVGALGWCAVDDRFRLVLLVFADVPARITLDGAAAPEAAGAVLPETARQIQVWCQGREVAGSPLDLAFLRRSEGMVVLSAGRLSGWLAMPAAPRARPQLVITARDGTSHVVVAREAMAPPPERPFLRPRRFALGSATLKRLPPPWRVIGPDGRELAGSPIEPVRALKRFPRPPAILLAPLGAPTVVVPAPSGVKEGWLAELRTACGPRVRIVVIGPERVAGANALAHPAPASAAGLAAGLALAPADAVLLCPGARPPAGWLKRLKAAVYAAPDIAAATCFDDGAAPFGLGPGAPASLGPRTAALEVPPPPGCLYLRADIVCACRTHLACAEGALTEVLGKARVRGWRVVLAPDVIVPGARFADAPAQDTPLLARARRRLAAALWRRQREESGAVLLVTHDEGGGVERFLAARAAGFRAEGLRPVFLRPAAGRRCQLADDRLALADMAFSLPREWRALKRFLARERPLRVELHHLLGHHGALLRLASALSVPAEVYVHDYAFFCPRITMLGALGAYCGEPNLAGCRACVAEAGSRIGEAIDVAALRARSARVLRSAARVVVPAADVAARIKRYVPGLKVVVSPWENDSALPAPIPLPAEAQRKVLVIGAIGIDKGYDVLLAAARDAAARNLPLSFVLVGHSIDDALLLQTGRVFVTGRYREEEAEALVRGQGTNLAFLPSVWPETWCFALSLAWRAGLRVVAFDLGAPAERIRASGRGWLLPLGAPPAAINAALLAAR